MLGEAVNSFACTIEFMWVVAHSLQLAFVSISIACTSCPGSGQSLPSHAAKMVSQSSCRAEYLLAS